MTHCVGLEGSLRDHIATTYGVSRNSILNSLKYFSVTNCLVPDVMHDVLEGSLQLCTKLVLNQFIVDKKLFTLGLLNQRITSYKYGPAITEKPSSISRTTLGTNDGKLHQSGMILMLQLYYTCTIKHVSFQHHRCGVWADFCLFLLETLFQKTMIIGRIFSHY